KIKRDAKTCTQPTHAPKPSLGLYRDHLGLQRKLHGGGYMGVCCRAVRLHGWFRRSTLERLLPLGKRTGFAGRRGQLRGSAGIGAIYPPAGPCLVSGVRGALPSIYSLPFPSHSAFLCLPAG